ncbi:MAG: hypothetical protein MK171_06855 [Pirellulales bacterium]|nr:hypothetical protein [Pirellulales bacterium]
MNLLAKIITVVILIASLMMMFLSVTVYSTHKNWKAIAANLTTERDSARDEVKQNISKHDRAKRQLDADKKATLEENIKLKTERQQLLDQNSTIQLDLESLRKKERANTTALALTQENNEKLATEVERLTTEIRINQQSRDEAFATALEATGDLHEAQGRLTLLLEQNAQLAQDLGTKTSLLRSKGVDPNTPSGQIVPILRGVVSAMHRNAGTQLIEITIGADDGLKKGHTVEVFRGDRYLGRAEIMKTEPDRAVGRVLRRFQQGQIQENDNVATKLRIG